MASMQDIAMIVAKLSAAYPNWTPNEYTVEVYYQDLRDIPTEELHTAVQSCRSESGRRFAPSTGEIRGAISDLRRMVSGTPSPFEAWQSFLRYVSDGTYMHPLAKKTMELLGERNLRMSENQVADRARFVECYEQLVSRSEKEEMLIPEIRGYIEANGGKLLAPMSQIGLLADKLTVKK